MRLHEAGRLAAGLAILAVAGWALPASAAGPQALVIGNGTYAYLPPLPACPAAAKLVASALRGAGFTVTEKENLPSGAMQAALSAFGQSLGASPQGAAVIYVCGYASAFNDRSFLLPVSAVVALPSDALAQGVLAKSVVNVLPNGATGALVFDSVPMRQPGTPAPGFDVLKTAPLPPGIGVVAATEAKPGDAPTPVANALAGGLHGSRLSVADLLAGMQRAVPPTSGAAFAVLRPPAAPALLIGAPEPPPRAEAKPPPPTPAAPPAAAPPAPAPASPPPPALTPAPEEARMTDAERRRVQSALVQLGYYDGRIDGIFGPNTRAAIRRYQHELKAEMTGTLTPDQAARLFAAVR